MKIKPGDKLPHNDFFYLDESNEVKKISTNDLFSAGKMIILGMPGAFTKTCSAIHLPGYVKNYDLAKKTKASFCITTNILKNELSKRNITVYDSLSLIFDRQIGNEQMHFAIGEARSHLINLVKTGYAKKFSDNDKVEWFSLNS